MGSLRLSVHGSLTVIQAELAQILPRLKRGLELPLESPTSSVGRRAIVGYRSVQRSRHKSDSQQKELASTQGSNAQGACTSTSASVPSLPRRAASDFAPH